MQAQWLRWVLLSRVRQQKNASLPPRRSAFPRLANAAAGSSKYITPKLLSTT